MKPIVSSGLPDTGEVPLRMLVESAIDDAIFLLDPEGKITTWGPGAERTFGYPKAEVVGQSFALLFTPEDRKNAVPDRELRLAAARGHLREARWHQRRDGRRLWGEGSLTALYAARGGLQGFCKILRDLTERYQVSATLQTDLARERRITEVLQRPLTLPIAIDAFPGIKVVTHYEAAMDEALIGGDFFDAFELPRGHVALVVADASGKGLSAAARAIHIKEVLRAFAREYPQSPDRIAERLNDYAGDITRLDENSESAFVTLTLTILDPQTGEASIANAGAEPPLLIRGTSGTVEPVQNATSCGLPLGIQKGETYKSVQLRLAPGDRLLMVTDGITESRRSGPNDLLGQEGLIRLIRQAQGLGLQEAANHLLESARTFANGGFRDDVCLLMAQRTQRDETQTASEHEW